MPHFPIVFLCVFVSCPVSGSRRAHPTAEGVRQQMEIILDNMVDPKKTLHFLGVNWWFHLISQHAYVLHFVALFCARELVRRSGQLL